MGAANMATDFFTVDPGFVPVVASFCSQLGTQTLWGVRGKCCCLSFVLLISSPYFYFLFFFLFSSFILFFISSS